MRGSGPITILMKIYHFTAAMQTGLFLLVLVGLAAALGSAFLPDIFFKTIVFKLLLSLLFINLALCTWQQLRRLVKAILNGTASRLRLIRQIGLGLLHMGIVLIIAGGAVNTYWGQSGEIRMVKDERVDIGRVINLEDAFSLQLDDFRMPFNEDGSVAQYYSDLTIMRKGKAKKQAAVSVNHPLSYGGIKAYQMSFGYLISVKEINASGEQPEKLCQEGDFMKIPASQKVLKVYRYLPDFDPEHGMTSKTMRPDNPHVVFSVYENKRLLGVGAAKLGEKVRLEGDRYVVFGGVQPYTILKLKADPGLPLVLCGGIALSLGLILVWLVPLLNPRSASQSFRKRFANQHDSLSFKD